MEKKPKITICMGSSCFARGNERNLAFVEEFLEKRGLKDEVDVELDGSLCTGNCASGPVVIVDGKVHTRVDRGLMGDVLESLFPENAK
ncbi:MAG: (2Fe-2S) ferredoxin domain-containing protein [Kiritimatiellae bacterium]|nr:(2Fe-2S) ferredoxin domain-containing protein [Kiritimatiellia bacterium]